MIGKIAIQHMIEGIITLDTVAKDAAAAGDAARTRIIRAHHAMLFDICAGKGSFLCTNKKTRVLLNIRLKVKGHLRPNALGYDARYTCEQNK